MCNMCLKETVMNCFSVLNNENDLSPRNSLINKTLGHFVTAVSDADVGNNIHILSDASVISLLPGLRAMLSHSEAEMEKYFADRFIAQTDLCYDDLKSFLYWDNYRALAEKEITLMQNAGADKQSRMVFVGAGALPLSAIIISELAGYKTECIDCDKDAVTKSQDIIGKVMPSGRVKSVCSSGTQYDYADADIVFIAALVDAKEKVISRIRETRAGKETLLLIRSAEDLNTLLYCPFNECELGCTCFERLGKTEYCRQTINTTLLYRI